MSLGVKAGEIEQQIEVQVATIVENTAGNEVKTWAKEADVFAKIMPMKAGEKFNSQREMANTYCRFLIRYYQGLTRKKHRLVWRTQIFDIINIEEHGRQNLEYMIVLGEILESN